MTTDNITTTAPAAPDESPNLETQLQSLGAAFERDGNFTAAVWKRIDNEQTLKIPRRLLPSAFSIRGAVAAILVIGVCLALWSVMPSNNESDAWWLGNQAALAAEIETAIQQAVANGVTCRESTQIIMPDSSRQTSSTTSTLYTSATHYRRDIHDAGALREIQYYEPSSNGMTQTSIRYDSNTFTIDQHIGSFGNTNPIQRMRFLVRQMNNADRLLESRQINGRACVGFEIRQDQYGDNPPQHFDRIWFDQQTRLPARIEFHGAFTSGDPPLPIIRIQENFDYAPTLAPTFFKASIPDDFQPQPQTP